MKKERPALGGAGNHERLDRAREDSTAATHTNPEPCSGQQGCDRIGNALNFVPADDRETWLRMGMAIKSELGDAGFDLWDAWSQQAESYKNGDARDVWRSIKPDGGVTIGTLFHEAKVNGWRDDKTDRRPPREAMAEHPQRAAREQENIQRERQATASKATAIWKAAAPAQADHPYLVRKQVAPADTLREIDASAAASILGYRPKSGGEPLTGRLLVVPVKQGDSLSTLELIDGAGRKTALAGRGTKAGGYWASERLPDGDGAGLSLLLGEGVATVLSASEATGHPGIAALSSGNLPVVAKAMRERYPAAELVILADVVKADGKPDPHAIAAAQAVGGKLAVPDFGPDRDPGMTDFNDMAAICGLEAVGRAIADANEPAGGVGRPCDENAPAGAEDAPEVGPAGLLYDSDGKPVTQAAVLIKLGSRHRLFHDPGGTPYAAVDLGDRRAVLRVDGADYREVLGREYFALSGKGANRNAVGDAVATLAAKAKYDGPEEPVFLRCADMPDGIALDMGGETGEAVIATASGWRIDSTPLHFRRAGKPQALPRPGAERDFARLWRYVNAAEGDRVLVAAWLLAALRPRGPYPILLLVGEQGSGKSAASRALKRLTDPSAALLRPPPRDTRDLLVGALGSWVLALDNLSGANADLSDALCRLSTGGALAERRLYTNDEEALYEVQRPVILNGIEDPATRPDLADRCLHLLLPQLQDRRTESDFERGFQADAPAIFAALLDGLSLAIRDHGSVRLGKLPRLADFAVWASAGLPALGFTAGEFMAAYQRNRAELLDTAIEASPVASALVHFMCGRERWEGSSAELLRELADTDPGAAQPPAWPRSTKGLLGILRRLAPALRARGIELMHRKTERRNLLEVCKSGKNPPDVPDVPATAFEAGASGPCWSMHTPDVPAENRAAGASGTSGASFATSHDAASGLDWEIEI